MSAEDRNAWVAVARATLSGIPADLLNFGCNKARETCRFPSEIVPTIIAETREAWDRRIRMAEHERAREANRNAPRLEQPEYVSPEEVEQIKREVAEAMKAKRAA